MDLLTLVEDLGLCLSAPGVSHHLVGLLSIDHVALRGGAEVSVVKSFGPTVFK